MCKLPDMRKTACVVKTTLGAAAVHLWGDWPSPGEVTTGHPVDLEGCSCQSAGVSKNTTRSHALYDHIGLTKVKVRMLMLGLNPAPVHSQGGISLCD